MSNKRRRVDKNQKVLRTGETCRKDGRGYEFKKVINGIRLTVTSPTLEGLRIKEAEIEKDRILGIDIKTYGMTLNDVYEKWKIFKKTTVKFQTYLSYCDIYDYQIKNVLGAKKLKDIKKSDIKVFYAKLIEEKHYHKNTLNNIQRVLYNVLQSALEDNLIMYNPASNALKGLKTDPKAKKNNKAKYLSEEQFNTLIKYLRSVKRYKYWAPIIEFLYLSGMRISELCGLCYDDIHDGWIHVNNNYIKVFEKGEKPRFIMTTPKTESSIRDIPLSDDLKRLLEEYIDNINSLDQRFKDNIDGYSIIFRNTQGRALCENSYNYVLKRIITSYNNDPNHIEKLPYFTPHAERRSFSTTANEKNMNPVAIASVMGHKNPDITFNRYVQSRGEYVKEEIKKFSS